ncbi:IS1182 family transposase, partial [Lysinibacillus sp. NPDC096418]|uniref:IS1182 family transposase n=1 Tax=Lysinibacillus sp. NPDC096418 TaxID=3364138 RepID=UPI00380915C1
NANKFTFVWKKSIERHHINLIEKSNQLYNKLLEDKIIPEINRENDEQLSIEELTQIAQKLDEVVDDYTIKVENADDVVERKRLRSERKTPKQIVKQVYDWITRKQKYERDFEIFDTRNSYSKTDNDATFMRMKDDYMQNGQLKAGYNVQVATEGQFTLAYGVFPNPTDMKTLIPFLDQIEKQYFDLPKHIVADAGYGSEQNYDDILTKHQRIPLITYNHYLNEQKRKFKNDRFKTSNWVYDAERDMYTCPNEKQLTFQYNSVRTDKFGFNRQFKIYECEDCTGCPLRELCTKAREGTNRRLTINEKWEQQKEYVRAKLSEEKTGAIYRKRKIDVEPVFGFLKANLGFTRFSVRGKSKVENDIGLALMAVNLRKYAVRG